MAGTTKLMDDSSYYKQVSDTKNPYGDGKASEIIKGIIKAYKP